MQDWLSYLPSDRDGQMQVGYIGFCIILLFAIYFSPNKTREAETRDPVATRRWQMRDQERRAARPGLRIPAIFSHVEGPGVGAIMHFLILAGMLTAGLIGWRIPAEIERLYGDGAGFGLIFPNVTMPTIGKAAQVIGAFTFALVALRLLRLIVPLMTFAMGVTLVVMSIQYVFDISILDQVRSGLEATAALR